MLSNLQVKMVFAYQLLNIFIYPPHGQLFNIFHEHHLKNVVVPRFLWHHGFLIFFYILAFSWNFLYGPFIVCLAIRYWYTSAFWASVISVNPFCRTHLLPWWICHLYPENLQIYVSAEFWTHSLNYLLSVSVLKSKSHLKLSWILLVYSA